MHVLCLPRSLRAILSLERYERFDPYPKVVIEQQRESCLPSRGVYVPRSPRLEFLQNRFSRLVS